MRSIKTKMIVLMSAMLLSICALLSFLSFRVASSALVSNVNDTLPQTAEQAGDIIEARISGTYSQLMTLVLNNEINDPSKTQEEKISLLKPQLDANKYKAMGIADKTGKMISTSGETIDISSTGYFKKALSGENMVSNPEASKADNSIEIIYAVPIKNGNEITGVLTATVANGLQDIISDITYGKSGKAYMLNKEGTTIAHTDEQLVINKDNDFENIKKDPSLK